jgi:hypothetical protein
MKSPTNIAVTLTAALYERLRAESKELGVSMEWLVASLVVDTLETERVAARLA